MMSDNRSLEQVAVAVVVSFVPVVGLAGCSSCPPCTEVAAACPSATAAAAGTGASPHVAPGSDPSAGPVGEPASAAGPPRADMVRVAAGPFLRGSPPGTGLEDEDPQRTLTLDTFDIDRTEVSVAQYQKCVAAGRCPPPSCTKDSDEPEKRSDHPVVCVGWEQAKTYCAWAGKRLPTEAEWEKAARGTDGRTYPWGSEKPSCKLANYSGCADPESTHPVGSLTGGASPYGAVDLAGNVWEWVSDWYHEEYYTISPAENPTGPALGEHKIVRGGAYRYGEDDLDSAGRTFDSPTKAYVHVGVRCAMSVRGR